MNRWLQLLVALGIGAGIGWVVRPQSSPPSRGQCLAQSQTPPAVATVLVPGPLAAYRSLPVILGADGEDPVEVERGLRDGDGLIRVTILDGDTRRNAFVTIPAR